MLFLYNLKFNLKNNTHSLYFKHEVKLSISLLSYWVIKHLQVIITENQKLTWKTLNYLVQIIKIFLHDILLNRNNVFLNNETPTALYKV